MEITKQEVEIVSKTVEFAEKDVIELSQLQLALVGGGGGEVIFG
jgi:hypothetical protein